MKEKIFIGIVIMALVIFAFLFVRNQNQIMKTSEEKNTSTIAQKKLPFSLVDTNKKYQAVMETTEGTMTLDLYVDKTPITVSNFINLAKKGFYDNTIFHRIIAGFMIQGGDPNGNGTGNPGYKFDDEPFEGEYTKGTLAMANSGPNTNGSQFFIMHEDKSLPKDYVIFGQVSEGLDVVDKIATAPVTSSAMEQNSTPVNPVKITSVKIIEK